MRPRQQHTGSGGRLPQCPAHHRHRQFTGDDRSREGRSPGHGVPDLRCPEFALTWGGLVRRGVFQRLHPVGPRPSPAHPGHARPAPPRRNARRAGSHELSGAHPPDHRGTCRLGRVARRTRLRADLPYAFPRGLFRHPRRRSRTVPDVADHLSPPYAVPRGHHGLV